MTALGALLLALAVVVWPARRSARAVRSRLRGPDFPDHEHAPGLGERAMRAGRRLGLPGSRSAGHTGQWLSVLDELSASLRAGLPAGEALAMSVTSSPATVRTVLLPVLEAAQDGRPGAAAWLRAARSATGGELELVARSWAISEQLGAPLADAVESAARGLRDERALRGRLDAATAGARTTANILTLLPVAGVGIALLMGIGPAELYGSGLALTSLAAGVVLIAVGRVVVTRMIRRVTAAP